MENFIFCAVSLQRERARPAAANKYVPDLQIVLRKKQGCNFPTQYKFYRKVFIQCYLLSLCVCPFLYFTVATYIVYCKNKVTIYSEIYTISKIPKFNPLITGDNKNSYVINI